MSIRIAPGSLDRLRKAGVVVVVVVGLLDGRTVWISFGLLDGPSVGLLDGRIVWPLFAGLKNERGFWSAAVSRLPLSGLRYSLLGRKTASNTPTVTKRKPTPNKKIHFLPF